MVHDEILTASELRFVMDDIKNFSPNFVENSVPVQQLLNDPLDVNAPSSTLLCDTSAESIGTRSTVKRKKMKRMCDSTRSSDALPRMPPIETLPCLEPYSGHFDFQLHLPTNSSIHRWTVLALQFKWNYHELENDAEMFVRAMPVYTSDDSLNVPVHRCPMHVIPIDPLNIGFDYLGHVLRCEHSSTSYEQDPMTQRLSCRTPLSRPQPGSDTTTLTYKFVCKTSCNGGMNRKPISVIFTLEDANGSEYGRQMLAVKICSCPKRDKKKEEDNEIEKNESSSRGPVIRPPVPSMICVRNTNVQTSTHEPLHDIKNVVANEVTLKKANQEEEEDTMSRAALARMLKAILHEMEYDKSNSYRSFGKYVEAQLQEMPPECALEVQNDIQAVICEKKRQVLRKSTSFLPYHTSPSSSGVPSEMDV